MVVDPQWVTAHFRNSDWPENEWTAEQDFWNHEFDPQRPVPTRLEDLVIYEMHIGGLGAGKTEPDGTPVPGDIGDAIGMLDYLVDLGVNAVEMHAAGAVRGLGDVGVRHLALLRRRVQRRRPRRVQILCARLPPTRHRGHPRRRLQPLQP